MCFVEGLYFEGKPLRQRRAVVGPRAALVQPEMEKVRSPLVSIPPRRTGYCSSTSCIGLNFWHAYKKRTWAAPAAGIELLSVCVNDGDEKAFVASLKSRRLPIIRSMLGRLGRFPSTLISNQKVRIHE
jgi:hypothetical protein